MSDMKQYFESMYKEKGIEDFIREIVRLYNCSSTVDRKDAYHAVESSARILQKQNEVPLVENEGLPVTSRPDWIKTMKVVLGSDPSVELDKIFGAEERTSSVTKEVIDFSETMGGLKCDVIDVVQFCKAHSDDDRLVLHYLAGQLLCIGHVSGNAYVLRNHQSPRMFKMLYSIGCRLEEKHGIRVNINLENLPDLIDKLVPDFSFAPNYVELGKSFFECPAKDPIEDMAHSICKALGINVQPLYHNMYDCYSVGDVIQRVQETSACLGCYSDAEIKQIHLSGSTQLDRVYYLAGMIIANGFDGRTELSCRIPEYANTLYGLCDVVKRVNGNVRIPRKDVLDIVLGHDKGDYTAIGREFITST